MRRYGPRHIQRECSGREAAKIDVSIGDGLAKQPIKQGRCVLLFLRQVKCVDWFVHS